MAAEPHQVGTANLDVGADEHVLTKGGEPGEIVLGGIQLLRLGLRKTHRLGAIETSRLFRPTRLTQFRALGRSGLEFWFGRGARGRRGKIPQTSMTSLP